MKWKILAFSAFLLAGCSNRDVFMPKKYETKTLKTGLLDNKEVKDYSKNSLTLRELQLNYDKNGQPYWKWVNYDLKGHKLNQFVKSSDDLAIYKNRVLLIKENRVVDFPYLVFDVEKKGNLLAVLFENNYYGIYDLNSKKFLFLDNGDETISARYLHAKPIFYKDLVLFPLLSGEVAVVDGKSFKYLRSIPVSDDKLNSSIIFMKVLGDSLIIASNNKVINFNPMFLFSYSYNIKHIVLFDGKVVVITIDGRVIFLDNKLKKLKTIDFKNADFLYPTICNGKLDLLSYNGYLVEIEKDYSYKILKLKNRFDKNYLIKMQGCKIYNADEVFEIE